MCRVFIDKIFHRGAVQEYQAYCDCGWRGPLRNSITAADDDATAHEEPDVVWTPSGGEA